MVTPGNEARQAFYNDVSQSVAEKYMAKLLPQSRASLASGLSYLAYRDVPTHYVLCQKDRALSPTVQQNMIDSVGVDVTTHVLESGHSPMLSMPEATASIIRKAAGVAV